MVRPLGRLAVCLPLLLRVMIWPWAGAAAADHRTAQRSLIYVGHETDAFKRSSFGGIMGHRYLDLDLNDALKNDLLNDSPELDRQLNPRLEVVCTSMVPPFWF